MQSKILSTMQSSYRTAGWSAIASGAIGIFAIGTLIAYLVFRSLTPDTGILMNRLHDAGVFLQFLLMIPVTFGLQKLSQQKPFGMSQPMLATGITAICFVALFLLLIFPKVVSDILYMLPQGAFGVWLIFISVHMKGLLSKGLRWFGIIVGLGLSLIGVSVIEYAIFVDTIILQIPAAPNELIAQVPINTANVISHQMLFIGTFLGVLTLPFWTILIGRKLLREKGLLKG